MRILETVSQQERHEEQMKLGLTPTLTLTAHLSPFTLQELHEEQLKRTPAPRGRGGGAEESGGEIYFVGLIDILCEYGLKKQLEHHYKVRE